MNSTLALVFIGLLIAIGIGLFLYNIKQAISGYRAQRKLEEDFSNERVSVKRNQELINQLAALKILFGIKTIKLSATERNKLWKPVDDAIVAVFQNGLTGNSTKANSLLESTLVKAKQIVDQLPPE